MINPNVLVIGKSGVGKSTLLNYIFGSEIQKTGTGAPQSPKEFKKCRYKYDEDLIINIYDTWGLEAGKKEEWTELIEKEIKRHNSLDIFQWFNTILFCFSAGSDVAEEYELEILKSLIKDKNHVVVCITNCKNTQDPSAIKLKNRIIKETKTAENNIVFVNSKRAKNISQSEATEPFGKEDVLRAVTNNLWRTFESKIPYEAEKNIKRLCDECKDLLFKETDTIIKSNIFTEMAKFRINKNIKKIEDIVNDKSNELKRNVEANIRNMYFDAFKYYQQLAKKYLPSAYINDFASAANGINYEFNAKYVLKKDIEVFLNIMRGNAVNVKKNFKNEKKFDLSDALLGLKKAFLPQKYLREQIKIGIGEHIDSFKTYFIGVNKEFEKKASMLIIE